MFGAVRAAAHRRPEGRARLAAWATRLPPARRALLLAVGAGVLGAVFGAAMSDPVVRDLNPAGRAVTDPVADALHAAWGWSLGGVCAGLAYAAVSARLLAPARARRWAAGGVVGVACAVGQLAAVGGRGALAHPLLAVVVFVLFGLLGVWCVVPPAWSVAKAQAALAAEADAGAP